MSVDGIQLGVCLIENVEMSEGEEEHDRSLTEENAESEQQTTSEASVKPVPEDVIDELATGCVAAFVPDLSRARDHFQELLHNQDMLLERMQATTRSFAERPEVEEILAVSVLEILSCS